MTMEKFKFYGLFGLLFAFYIAVFIFTAKNVFADYVTPTGCTYSDTGTHYDTIVASGNRFSTTNEHSTSLSTDIYLYSVDNACGLIAGVGANTNAGVGDEIGVEMLSTSTFKIMNFTTNTQIGTNQTLAQGAKGFILNVYQSGDPSNQNQKSDSYTFELGNPPLEFLSPVDNRIGTDFLNFAFTSDFANVDTGSYRIRVDYGLGNTTDFTDYGEFNYMYSGLTYDQLPVPKTNALTVDTGYQAVACLVDNTETDVYCAQQIEFDIVAGSQSNYFTGIGVIGGVDPQSSCGTTTFAIPEFDLALGYTFPRVDFGQGVCKTVAFLFVPKQSTLQEFENIKTLIVTKAPFSYFDQATDALTGVTGSTGTIPTLNISTGTGTAVDVSVDIFSPTSLNMYTNSTVRALLRALMQAVLYLAFIGFVVYETRKLFNKQQT